MPLEKKATLALEEILVSKEALASQVLRDRMDRLEQLDSQEELVEQEHLVYLVPQALLDFLEKLADKDSLEIPEVQASEDFRDSPEIPGNQAPREVVE